MTAPKKSHGRTQSATAAVCTAKVRFSDEPTARAMAQHMLQTHDDLQVSRLFVYCCPICRGWHITRAYQPGKAAVTATDPYASRDASAARTGARQ